MDATRDDEAPATQKLVVMCEGSAWRLRQVGQLNRDPKDIEAEAKRWDWLASHLPEMIADITTECPRCGLERTICRAAHLSGERQ